MLMLLGATNLLAVAIFARGFLSARIELTERGKASDFVSFAEANTHTDVAALSQPHFDRVVLLIVDALRVDMVFPHVASGRDPMQHEGQMPRLVGMLEDAVSGMALSVYTCIQASKHQAAGSCC